MSHGVSFRAEAFADVAEAFSWYQAQRSGLGDEFLADEGIEVLAVLHTRRDPTIWRRRA